MEKRKRTESDMVMGYSLQKLNFWQETQFLVNLVFIEMFTTNFFGS